MIRLLALILTLTACTLQTAPETGEAPSSLSGSGGSGGSAPAPGFRCGNPLAFPNADGTDNMVQHCGWNVADNGAPLVAGEHAAMMSIESGYLPGAPGTARIAEWHWQYRAANGTPARFLTAQVNLDTHKSAVGILGEFGLADSTGTAMRLRMVDTTAGASLFVGSPAAFTSLRFDYPDAPMLYQIRADGQGWAEMMRLDGSDDLVLGKTVPGRFRVECADRPAIGGADLEARVAALEAALVTLGLAEDP